MSKRKKIIKKLELTTYALECAEHLVANVED